MALNNDSDISKKSSTSSRGRTIVLPRTFIMCLVLVIVGLACFYGGMTYEKHHYKPLTSATTASSSGSINSNGLNSGNQQFQGGSRTVGQVTAVSPTSITVNNSRTGTSSTLAITSSTLITDNGQSATASDIQVGQTVFIREDPNNTSDAASILISPNFGGGNLSPPTSSGSVTE
jgi:hypothetical protein